MINSVPQIRLPHFPKRFWVILFGIFALLAGCTLPQVQAQTRLFLPLEIKFIEASQLPNQDFNDTKVGGLSGITYDRQNNHYYAISDDRQQPRFYTLKLQPPPAPTPAEIRQVTFLQDKQSAPLAPNTADPEGIALTPEKTLLISSEGVKDQAPPFIAEFGLDGIKKLQFRLPSYYTANPDPQLPPQGVQNNQGFESLTLNPTGDRLFVATETGLKQDLDPENQLISAARILHYLRGDVQPILIAEHAYLLDPAPKNVAANGLVELLALDNGGHFLSLERTFSLTQGFGVKLFQVSLGGAADISTLRNLPPGLAGIKPVRKALLLDLGTLGITLDNLEGMTLGPQLVDGTSSLVIIGDNDFQAKRTTQILWFSLTGLGQS
ncbi:esterase-like activity of phytase family protein [Thermosynechococcaceae cyanobacterium BACA0444]|uniref:Esterase-like activity of phytase family protein n=1 Tax=Pseudocalidococcus azoricus BACA0444 TaxID=2918990 RepID=A0AAE4JV32_9CYAN|nr:esterase-like activity of phytase family protein [Pseudocalidococcus azoricus]MDS3859965.1 esterase-like activity of phytase family protein [Pseudocalidococcus azoricus BACA0444]